MATADIIHLGQAVMLLGALIGLTSPQRPARLFNMFNVVSFPNSECTASSTTGVSALQINRPVLYERSNHIIS